MKNAGRIRKYLKSGRVARESPVVELVLGLPEVLNSAPSTNNQSVVILIYSVRTLQPQTAGL